MPRLLPTAGVAPTLSAIIGPLTSASLLRCFGSGGFGAGVPAFVRVFIHWTIVLVRAVDPWTVVTLGGRALPFLRSVPAGPTSGFGVSLFHRPLFFLVTSFNGWVKEGKSLSLSVAFC